MRALAERFIRTVEPQKDIWPHNRTNPMKAVAIAMNNRMILIIHVSRKI